MLFKVVLIFESGAVQCSAACLTNLVTRIPQLICGTLIGIYRSLLQRVPLPLTCWLLQILIRQISQPDKSLNVKSVKLFLAELM